MDRRLSKLGQNMSRWKRPTPAETSVFWLLPPKPFTFSIDFSGFLPLPAPEIWGSWPVDKVTAVAQTRKLNPLGTIPPFPPRRFRLVFRPSEKMAVGDWLAWALSLAADVDWSVAKENTAFVCGHSNFDLRCWSDQRTIGGRWSPRLCYWRILTMPTQTTF